MKIGYLPDTFGHSSSVPKLLKGAGIPCAVIWRGAGDEIKNTEFIWEGNDGSKILTVQIRDLDTGDSNCIDLDPGSAQKCVDILMDYIAMEAEK